MSQIVFHRPYRRQRQHSNVIFKIRQTDRGCIWHACMLPSLSTSAQCGETIHLQQIRHHFFFFPHQRTEFYQLRSGRGHSWEERKLYKTVFEYFLGHFPGERLMNFHLNRYFRISHLSQSLLIFLPPLPSCPFWYLAVHKVYIFPQFRISLFFSPSLSLWLSLLVLGLLVLDGLIFISYCSARCGWRVGVGEQNLK